MINYVKNITKSGISIYDKIDSTNPYIYIPTNELEYILSKALIGMSLGNLPLRTRSKVVKKAICTALGYPVPSSFKKSHPRFPGQHFDVYIQKTQNVQIWNEDVDSTRRYIFLHVDNNDIITAIKIVIGSELVQYDRTGKLTKKYQATMKSYGKNFCSSTDSNNVINWITPPPTALTNVSPNSYPARNQLLAISEVYQRLLPMVGQAINYLDAVQERNRGAELHSMICAHLGYSTYEDDGTYPDIANQLLEVKLQTSPTIDLGMHSPTDGECIMSIGDTSFFSQDMRYAIFNGYIDKNKIILKNLYLVTGEDFTNYFPLFKGKETNSKIQFTLPHGFFN